MRSVKILAALLLAAAVPATAQTFGFSLGTVEPACLSIRNASYRLTNTARPDIVVRLEPAAAAAGMRIQIADTPDEADFVFVDDGEGDAPACPRGPFKSVKIDPTAAAPDLVVGLARPDATANYRIYVARACWMRKQPLRCLPPHTRRRAHSRAVARIVRIDRSALVSRQP